MHDITLYIFGGAAHITREPRRARDEFFMAAAGPLSSLAIGGAFGLLWWLTPGGLAPLRAVAGGLGWINTALAIFNLVPGFPLDGGRVFRALVWGATGSLHRATVIAVRLGRAIAFGFIFWGVWQVFGGNWADGLWIAFIGWFLDSAATQAYRQMALREILAGHTAREAMATDCPSVLRRLTIDTLVHSVLLPSGRRCFVVIDDGRLAGLLTLHRIREAPRDQWPTLRVEDLMIPREALKTVGPDDPLVTVFERMVAEDVNQFPVMEGERFMGMVSRDTLLGFLHPRS